MKNKKFLWVLLPVVLVVWGLIFFQIKKAVSSGGKPVPVVKAQERLIVENRDTITYTLKLDYEDPFLKNKRIVVHNPSPVNSKPTPKKPKVVKTVTKLPVKWPVIVYKGLINNKKGNKAIYMLEVDGASLFMTPGEVRDELKLLKVYRDSVRMEYKGDEKRTFVKQ